MTTCALHDVPGGRCGSPAIYEMDIDRDEDWIPLCVEHGPTYRRSSNVRIRTRRTAPPDPHTAGQRRTTQEESTDE